MNALKLDVDSVVSLETVPKLVKDNKASGVKDMFKLFGKGFAVYVWDGSAKFRSVQNQPLTYINRVSHDDRITPPSPPSKEKNDSYGCFVMVPWGDADASTYHVARLMMIIGAGLKPAIRTVRLFCRCCIVRRGSPLVGDGARHTCTCCWICTRPV